MKDIKTKLTVKDIKTFDKAADITTHMKNAFVKSKDSAEQTQSHEHNSPGEYATDSVSSKARETTEQAFNHLKNPHKKAAENIDKTKQNFQNAKQHINEVKNAVKNPASDQPKKEMVKRGQETVRRTRQAVDKSIKTVQKSEKTIKQSAKTVKTASKGVVKTAGKSVKTAERTAKTAIKTTQQTAKATQRTAQAAAKAAKAAAQASRAAAKAAVQAAKIAVKVTIATVKAIIAATKALISAIAAGGWVAVVIILVICMVGAIVGSVFGIFYSGEDSGTGRSMPGVISELTTEFYTKIDDIKNKNPHDVVDIDAMSINWPEVLAVYAVKTNTDPDNPADVATLDDDKVEKLRAVLNDMTSLSYSLKTESQERTVTGDDGKETTETVTITRLIITLNQKSADEMATQYGFSAKQKEQMQELLSPDYADLWAQLLGGYSNGSGEIGNPDGSHVPKDIFSWPIGEGFSITSNYGYRKDPFTGETKYHGGTDIGAPEGTPILAAADGTVIVANANDSWGGGWGYYVKISHNSTYATLYAHCSKIAVVNGQAVKKGQIIAYVGTTGNSTGNHLHFEVYKDGSRTNPMGYFG